MDQTLKASNYPNLKNSTDLPTLLMSPGNLLDRSTVDMSHLSNANTSLILSPSPNRKLFDVPLSPIQSSSPIHKHSRKGPKSHSALEEKLMKIELDHSKSFIQDQSYDSPFKNHLVAVQVEEEDGSYSRRIMEIPKLAWCANCGGERVTKINYVNDSKTFWSSLAIFLSGGVFGCFLLPYMSNCCKGVQVVCGQCGRLVGE